MGFIDKARHKAEEVVGAVKEKVGDLTGDRELEAEGQQEQVTGNLKQAGDSAGDAARGIGDTVRRD
jgi:uncharacterized protein YjbJ (UPF0337 family)